jgi:hypothetical protein
MAPGTNVPIVVKRNWEAQTMLPGNLAVKLPAACIIIILADMQEMLHGPAEIAKLKLFLNKVPHLQLQIVVPVVVPAVGITNKFLS